MWVMPDLDLDRNDHRPEINLVSLRLLELSQQIRGLQGWTLLSFLALASIAIKVWFF